MTKPPHDLSIAALERLANSTRRRADAVAAQLLATYRYRLGAVLIDLYVEACREDFDRLRLVGMLQTLLEKHRARSVSV